MGHLVLAASIGDMRKVIISLWFRVPAETRALMRAIPGNNGGVVPLLCFGAQQNIVIPSLNFNTYGPDINCIPNTNPTAGFSTNWTGATSTYLGGPSFIGIWYGNFYNDGALLTNIQTSDGPSLTGVYFGETNVVCNLVGPSAHQWTSDSPDQSAAYASIADAYGNANLDKASISNQATVAAVDQWHHLLLSWDLTNGCSSFSEPSGGPDQNFVTSVSKMWCALDDTNKTGLDLPAIWANRVSDIQGWGPNDIVSAAVGGYAGSVNANATASLTVSAISGNFLSIPGPATLTPDADNGDGNWALQSAPVQKVELAELQIFVGVTLDTSVEENRRGFITVDGNPANMSLAQAVVGQPPDIVLHGSNNWIAGLNTGAVATPFEPTGTVTAFTPNPGN